MMSKTFFIGVFLLALSVVSSAQTNAKDEQILKSIIKQMTDAQTAYDAAALDRIFSSDYIEISPAGEFDPREKVLSFYTPQARAEAGNMSATVEATEFSNRSYGKFAVVIARFNYSVMNAGKPLAPRSMRVTIIFRKEKNSWKIASAQYTGIRQPTQKAN